MGEDPQEIIAKSIRQWHALTLKQVQTLLDGNLDEFGKLTEISAALQKRLDGLLPTPAKLDRVSFGLLKEIQTIQSDLITELQKGTREISNAIGKLRKNQTSMKGYRQTKPATPRFKSERT